MNFQPRLGNTKTFLFSDKNEDKKAIINNFANSEGCT